PRAIFSSAVIVWAVDPVSVFVPLHDSAPEKSASPAHAAAIPVHRVQRMFDLRGPVARIHRVASHPRSAMPSKRGRLAFLGDQDHPVAERVEPPGERL